MSKFPILTLPGYKTSPGINYLHSLPISKLSKVFFSVSNNFGEISFINEVDLTNINLDEILEITESSVTVYKDKSPLINSGLNVPAIITLYSFKRNLSIEKIQKLVKDQEVIL